MLTVRASACVSCALVGWALSACESDEWTHRFPTARVNGRAALAGGQPARGARLEFLPIAGDCTGTPYARTNTVADASDRCRGGFPISSGSFAGCIRVRVAANSTDTIVEVTPRDNVRIASFELDSVVLDVVVPNR